MEQTASRRATHWLGLTYVYILYLFTEYAGNIGDAKDPETRELEQDHIMQLVDKFWEKIKPQTVKSKRQVLEIYNGSGYRKISVISGEALSYMC